MAKSVLESITSAAMDVQRRMPGAQFVPREDLIGYGALGYCQARVRFQRGRGARFETVAWKRVRGAIIDGARSEYRRGPKHMPAFGLHAAAMYTPAPSPHDLLEAHELREERKRLVEAALAPLSEKDRAFLFATIVEGCSLEEAGAALGIKKSWASRRLKQLLADCRRRAEAARCP